MREIKTHRIGTAVVDVPGSKSATHRLMIAAALSNGRCRIENYLKSEDTLLTMGALKQMGIRMEASGGALIVAGGGGRLRACENEIYLGNSGTSMRLLTAVAALGEGVYRLNGTPRMQQRPIRDLIDGLRQLHVPVRSLNRNGCPPVEITGGILTGGRVDLNCAVSSQYLSALLLIAPCSREGFDIHVTQGPVSTPYVDMTVEVMRQLGVKVTHIGYERFQVPGRQTYRAGSYSVAPDVSQAGYFWLAAAITGGAVTVRGINRNTRQGDIGLLDVFESMGCRVIDAPDGITVRGGPLQAVEIDMSDMPDMVPTLAVAAAFAAGTTRITNVGHLKAKESDRLGGVVAELNRMGIDAACSDTGLTVTGGIPHGAEIETYEDHRMAMSFAVAGLRAAGISIRGGRCVEKSFPEFWQVFHKLYAA